MDSLYFLSLEILGNECSIRTTYQAARVGCGHPICVIPLYFI